MNKNIADMVSVIEKCADALNDCTDYLTAWRESNKPSPRYVVSRDDFWVMKWKVTDTMTKVVSDAQVAAFADRASAERHAASLNEVKP